MYETIEKLIEHLEISREEFSKGELSGAIEQTDTLLEKIDDLIDSLNDELAEIDTDD